MKNVTLSRTESRPRTFQQAIDKVCKLPITAPKGGSKSGLVVL